MAQVATFYLTTPTQNVSGSNPWDLWDFDSNTPVAQIPDSTADVQAAINAAQASGFGGVVHLPAGVIRVNGVTISGGGVTLRGTGWEEYDGAYNSYSPARRGKRGTYILTDNPANSAITVAANASNCKIEDLAFVQPHSPDTVGAGWAPTAYAPSIQLNGPNGGAFLGQRLLFWGCNTGIALGTLGNAVGRVTLRDIALATFGTGILAQYCTDTLTIDNVNYYPQLLAGNANQLHYVATTITTIAVLLNAVTKAVISKFSAKNVYSAIVAQSTADGSPGRVRITEADFEGCAEAIVLLSASIILRGSDLSFNGSAANNLAFVFTGANLTADFSDLYVTNYYLGVGTIFGAGCSIIFGNNVWFDNWNTGAGGAAALQSQTGTATTTVKYSSVTRLTNAGGGAFGSGPASFTTY